MHYTLCCTDFGVHHGGQNDVTAHVKSKKAFKHGYGSIKVKITYLNYRYVSHKVIEAKAAYVRRWATFVAKHILAFLSNNYATTLFITMSQKLLKSFLVVAQRQPPLSR